MSTVYILDGITSWLEENICKEIELKEAPSKTSAICSVKYVKPKAFAMYVPAFGCEAPSIKPPIPSICVQMIEGEDRPLDFKACMSIRLSFSAWNPGLHTKRGIVERNTEGWRDVHNFVDLAREKIESAAFIANVRVMEEKGIKFGPITEEKSIQDFYPYWFAYIAFDAEYALTRAKEYRNIL